MWGSIHSHVLETGIGYLISPLTNVAFGIIVFKERLTRTRRVAILIISLALLFLLSSSGELTSWIYLAIGFSFGGYSFFRKLGPLGAIEDLAFETLLLTLIVIAVVLLGETSLGFSAGPLPYGGITLLSLAGIVSIVPLWLFSVANRVLSLTTMGFFQYILTITQFTLALIYYRQIPSTNTLVCLSIIWLALVIVMGETALTRRAWRSA